MAELFEAIASWPTLVSVLLAFGFVPGFVLRLLVRAYPKNDPRRRELIAELYAVPRIQRPLWVAEQLEVALFEGIAKRWQARTRRNSTDEHCPSSTSDRQLGIIGSGPKEIQLAQLLNQAQSGEQQAWADPGPRQDHRR